MALNPSPDLAKALIAALTNPKLTFYDVALEFDLDVEDLAHWLLTPEIQDRLAVVCQAMESHARVLASTSKTTVLRAQLKTIQTYNDLATSTQPTATDSPVPDALHRLRLEVRLAENARKSTNIILKLASEPIQLQPAPAISRQPETHTAPALNHSPQHAMAAA